MSFTSYAQNFEDVILWQALQDVQAGFYVDAGAGHPERDSVTKAFYDRGWHGINIEPDGALHGWLQALRPRDVNLCVCAGPTDGAETFLYFDKGVGIVANDPRIADIFEHHGHTAHEALLGQRTLNSILAEYPPPDQIHFLKIDVEGYELQVLQGLDLERYRPWIVVGEASLPATQHRVDQVWSPLLLDNHYRFVYFDGLNCFYLAEEHARKTRWHHL